MLTRKLVLTTDNELLQLTIWTLSAFRLYLEAGGDDVMII